MPLANDTQLPSTQNQCINRASKKIIILDLCHLPHLTIWGHKMKTPHASSGTLKIEYKSPPCLTLISPTNKPLPHHQD